MYEFFSIGGSFCEKNNSRPKIVVFSGLFFVLLPQTEKRYAGIYLSGTVPRRGGQDEVSSVDERLCESRRMQRTQTAQDRPRGARAALESGLQRRIVLSAGQPLAEVARNSRRCRDERQ